MKYSPFQDSEKCQGKKKWEIDDSRTNAASTLDAGCD